MERQYTIKFVTSEIVDWASPLYRYFTVRMESPICFHFEIADDTLLTIVNSIGDVINTE